MNKIDAIRSILSEHEGALITDDSNRFYLTGFRSSAGAVFITRSSAFFFIDFRYYEKAKSVISGYDIVMSSDDIGFINDIIKQQSIKTVVVCTDYTSVKRYISLKNRLGIEISTDSILGDLISDLRSVKALDEINNIKLAQEYTDDTFSYILGRICEGRTERDIMLDMEFHMRRLGSDGVSFDFIVLSGKNTSLPHGVPFEKKIEKGDFVTMDFGAVAGGYRSDMTRTVAVGSVSDEQRAVYELTLKSQLSALDCIKAGAVCRDIDSVARNMIYDGGYKGCFGHGLGHGVGIDIHESPSFNTSCETVLKSGMIMTVEPGIYLSGKFGVRIEDMVCVTGNGCENLTGSDKRLIVL